MDYGGNKMLVNVKGVDLINEKPPYALNGEQQFCRTTRAGEMANFWAAPAPDYFF